MSGTLSALTDTEVMKSITNISEWLQSPCHTRSIGKLKEICAEDLAIGVPGECLFPQLTSENEEASREDEKGILVYTDNADEKFIWLNDDWHHLEKVLSIMSPKSGWMMTSSLWERLLMLILTQLDYAAKESLAEVPYGCCPLSDPVYLLWHNNKPVGMCSLKRKGSSIWGGEDVYACDSLDTLYVRAPYRRQGHAMSLLVMLTTQLPPGDHLGLSHPVSLSMCRVLLKFIQIYPSLRETLWTLDEDGEVCGTVLLMLGSLIVRGVLQAPSAPSQHSQQSRNERKEDFHYGANEDLISPKSNPAAKSSTSSNSQPKFQGSQDSRDVDDTQMTS